MAATTAPHVNATPDPALVARVTGRLPLRYAGGADPALDRPAHVRAGSGLARFGDRVVVVQDDANFVALIDPGTGEARGVPLPPGEDGRRQFDDRLGNKHLKLDLEACFAAPGEDGEPVVVALGSGSSDRRERIVVVRADAEAEGGATLVDGARLYAALRADPEFAPGEMNVEGAVYDRGVVRLFGRGNGAPRDGVPALNATCTLDWPALRRFLADPAGAPVPEPRAVVQYTLGELDGLSLGFTDATLAHDGATLLFAAAAEDSPDATRDGRVAGSALGVLEPGGTARWTVLRDEHGEPFTGKVEGILPVPGAATRLYAVVDQDDPGAPSELCEVELDGPWPSAARDG